MTHLARARVPSAGGSGLAGGRLAAAYKALPFLTEVAVVAPAVGVELARAVLALRIRRDSARVFVLLSKLAELDLLTCTQQGEKSKA